MGTTIKPRSYWDYIKAAFTQKVNVPGLGMLPVNILAVVGVGLLGIGFPALILLGLGIETAYLTWLAGNVRFQNLVKGRDLAFERETWNQRRETILRSLNDAGRKRHKDLIQKSLSISLHGNNPASDLFRSNLAGLLWTHLNLLASQEKVNSISDMVNRKKSQAEIEELEQRISTANSESALFRSLEASLTLAKKRLANLDRAEESAKVIDAEIERIERQIDLLREETALGQNPEMITGHLDSVTRSLEETGRWLTDNADILGDFSQPFNSSLSLPNQDIQTPSNLSRLSET